MGREHTASVGEIDSRDENDLWKDKGSTYWMVLRAFKTHFPITEIRTSASKSAFIEL